MGSRRRLAYARTPRLVFSATKSQHAAPRATARVNGALFASIAQMRSMVFLRLQAAQYPADGKILTAWRCSTVASAQTCRRSRLRARHSFLRRRGPLRRAIEWNNPLATSTIYIGQGQVDAARLCLDGGVEVDGVRNNVTPLEMACGNGQVEVATLLIDRGADVNRVDFATPLRAACGKDHVDAVWTSSI